MFFINPYNFVPLADKAPSHTENSEGDYTGYIEYDLYTKTPLFIPNTSNSDTFDVPGKVADHKSFEFFSYQDLTGKMLKMTSQGPEDPVIPGSEIRGMFRSNYEILTNSCLSIVDEDKDVVLAKRTNEVYKPGLIRKDGENQFSLYEAEDCLLRTNGALDLNDKNPCGYNDWKNKSFVQALPEGAKVHFERVERIVRGRPIKPLAQKVSAFNKPAAKEATCTGYLIKGELGPDMNSKKEKHCGHVFKVTGQRPVKGTFSLQVLETALAEYSAYSEHYTASPSVIRSVAPRALKSSMPSPLSTYAGDFKAFKEDKGKIGEFFPVYYSKLPGSTYIYLSPACITREIYQKKMSTLLGQYAPCNDKNNLCPGCSLFGTVGKDENGKMFNSASRVRFTDMHLKEGYEAKYENVVTLKELSSPKLSNTEFYLKRPDKDSIFWTYDYYVDDKGKVQLWDAEINGRKFYWHKDEVNLSNAEDAKVTARNITVRPLKNKVLFTGKVYFDHVTKTELDRLIYLINTGDPLNPDDSKSIETKAHGYKLGSGKPLGLGSVATSLRKVMVRQVMCDGEQIEWKNEPYCDYKVGDIDVLENARKGFEKLTSFAAIKNTKDIQYPKTAEEEDNNNPTIYAWFVNNHKKYIWDGTKGTMDSKMPTKRSEMAFEKYMIPLEAKLGSTISSGSDIMDVGVKADESGFSGCIKRYFPDKQYGYITVNGVKPDIKFQLSSFRGEDRNRVKEGCKVIVEYESYVDKNYEPKCKAVKCSLC